MNLADYLVVLSTVGTVVFSWTYLLLGRNGNSKEPNQEDVEERIMELMGKFRYLSANRLELLEKKTQELRKLISEANTVMSRLMVKMSEIERERIFIVYSGVDKTRFFKKEKDISFKKSLGISENETVISLIGNFSYDKGQHIFIDALQILEKKGYRFKVIFAGMKTDSKELIEMFSKKLSLNKGVFLGLRDDVEKILNITDISVNAAIKGEALSGSIRESLACGVPSIASNIGGNSEIIKDGENGFLFRCGDFIELAEKIEKLINDKAVREKFSENAIKTINENFNVDTMVEKTLQIYLSYVSNKCNMR